MKKFFASFLIMLMLFSVTAFASSGTYYLEDLELKITVPEDYYVITRETPESDPVFDLFGVSYDDIISQFKRDSIYFNALPSEGGEEIVVTMQSNIIDSFNDFSDSELLSFVPEIESQYRNMGFTVSDYELYDHPQAKFIKIYFKDAAGSVYGLQYYTIYDSMAMNFTMRSYNGSITYSQEDIITDAVNSIEFSYDSSSDSYDSGYVDDYDSDNDDSDDYTIGATTDEPVSPIVIILIIALVVIFAVVIIVVIKKKPKQMPAPNYNPARPPYNPAANQQFNSAPNQPFGNNNNPSAPTFNSNPTNNTVSSFCPYCGEKLSGNSAFCSKCGAKIK